VRPLKLLLLIIWLGACSLVGFGNKVTIINQGEQSASIKIWATEKLLWEGVLEAKQRETISFNLGGDGALKLEVFIDGRKIVTGDLAYVTPNDGQPHTVTITPRGEIKYTLGEGEGDAP
jgi:hypothetical protein